MISDVIVFLLTLLLQSIIVTANFGNIKAFNSASNPFVFIHVTKNYFVHSDYLANIMQSKLHPLTHTCLRP